MMKINNILLYTNNVTIEQNNTPFDLRPTKTLAQHTLLMYVLTELKEYKVDFDINKLRENELIFGELFTALIINDDFVYSFDASHREKMSLKKLAQRTVNSLKRAKVHCVTEDNDSFLVDFTGETSLLIPMPDTQEQQYLLRLVLNYLRREELSINKEKLELFIHSYLEQDIDFDMKDRLVTITTLFSEHTYDINNLVEDLAHKLGE